MNKSRLRSFPGLTGIPRFVCLGNNSRLINPSYSSWKRTAVTVYHSDVANMAQEQKVRSGLSDRFQNLQPGQQPIEVWEQLWQEQTTPWDSGTHNPALEETLLQKRGTLESPVRTEEGSNTTVVRRKKAFVPGCGRGWDVFLLASFGYDAYGLEYSTTALEACQTEAGKYGNEIPPKNLDIGSGSVIFMQGDFFEDEWLKDAGLQEGCFDLIYDYTFFCALHPSLRPKWALRHSQLLAPRGNLICLEFPTTKNPGDGGPPYCSTPAAYVEHLSHPGEDVPYDEKGYVKPNPLREISSDGLERVEHWQPEQTNNIGKDRNGNVLDWVSIWRHQ
ncbi:hypothetical protein FQN57_006428 [Myotisia sp. PD_48]|nr:hypothetical protein FQN57_006428 [Myotisia sp. PD_48]